MQTHYTLTTIQSENINDAAAKTAAWLKSGAQVVTCDLCPGNGTRYFIVLSNMKNAAPNGDPMVAGEYLLALPFFQTSYFTSLPGYTDAAYAAEKWTRKNMADGEVLSAFMNELSKNLYTSPGN